MCLPTVSSVSETLTDVWVMTLRLQAESHSHSQEARKKPPVGKAWASTEQRVQVLAEGDSIAQLLTA